MIPPTPPNATVSAEEMDLRRDIVRLDGWMDNPTGLFEDPTTLFAL
jgi:hypothetical protein